MRGVLLRFPGRRSSWAVIAGWIVLVVVFAPFGAKIADVTNDDYVLPGGSPTAKLQKTLQERFPGGAQRPAIFVYKHEGGLTEADQRKIVADALAVRDLKDVEQPIVPFTPRSPPDLVSRDGEVAFTVIPIRVDDIYHVTPTIEEMRERIEAEPPLEVYITGWSGIATDYNSAIKEADLKLFGATVALVLILLIAVYRSPILALVPLLVVGIAFSVANGIIYLLNQGIGLPVDTASNSLLLVLMFGAGTDYCLLLISRYGDRLRRRESAQEALREAIPEATPPMVASGVTVIAALLCTLAGIFGAFRTFGPVTAIGIAVVLLAGLTLLPAILSLLGRKAYWPNTRSVAPTGGAAEGTAGRWRAIGLRVRSRAGLYLGVALAFLLLACTGLTLWKTDLNPIAQFRTETESKKGFQILESAFPPGTVAPTGILVDRERGRVQPSDLEQVANHVRPIPGVARVVDTGRRSTDGGAALLNLIYVDDPFSRAAVERTRTVRDALADPGPGLSVLVGDGSADRVDLQNAVARDTKVIVPLVLLVVLITLIILLRALVAPLFLLATVVLSYAATLGLTILILKYVFGQDAFNSAMPVIIFIFLVALGSDYNIFLMSRVREESARLGTREGTLNALAATGPVITSAGLILAGTFIALTIIPSWDLTLIGLAVALGVILDTFLVRTVCVPALTWLFDERSWWPSSAEEGDKATVVSGVFSTQELLGVKRDE